MQRLSTCPIATSLLPSFGPSLNTKPDHVGIKFGARFKTTGLLTRTLLSSLYLATDSETNESVVLKTRQPSNNPAYDTIFSSFFENEIALMRYFAARPGHLDAVTYLHDADSALGRFLVMKHVIGFDLERLVGYYQTNNKDLELGQLKSSVKGLILALSGIIQAMHEAGVLHLDIKPSNVLVESKNGGLVVCDLGFAYKLVDLNRRIYLLRRYAPDMCVCTSYVAAPELVVGPSHKDSEIGPWTDVYALAINLYWMLSGFSIFPFGTASDAVNAQALSPFPNPASTLGVHNEISEVILKATRKLPQERFQTVNEFAQAVASANFW